MAEAQHIEKSTHTSTHTVHEEPKASLLSNILAIVGFIIVIVVVIWGLSHLASLSRGLFSSLFGRSANTSITVTAPATTTSGMPFTVSWKYSAPVKGSYAFLYECKSGFQFQTAGAGGTPVGIPCGATFTVQGTGNALSVTPFLSGDSNLSVPLSILFLPSATSTGSGQATQQAQGSATTVVVPSGVAPSTAPAPAPAYTAPEPAVQVATPVPIPAPKPATPADLSVRIISVTAGAATFDIANVGGKSSGTYYFTAQLPTVQSFTYTSPAQSSLAPGAHVMSTLNFSQAQAGGTFSVSVSASDTNQSNNTASQYMNAGYNAYNANYNSYGYSNTSYQYQNQSYPYQYQPYNAPAYPYSPYSNVSGQPYYNYQVYPYNQAVQPYPYYYQNPNYYFQQPYSSYYPYTY